MKGRELRLVARWIAALCLVALVLAQTLAFSHIAVMAKETMIVPQHAVVLQDTPSDDWPTYHRDTSRSGYDPLIPEFSSVKLNWTSTTLDGDVYAEPLVVGTNVIVATEQNSLYELSASNGQVLWHINFGTPVNGAVLPCGDINPSGITSTPAIDVSGGTIFVVAFLSNPILHHELFGVNLDTGAVKFQLGIDPSSSNFTATDQQQRGALALANGYVYVPYGGLDGDCGSYHGWVAGTSASGGGPVIAYQVPTGNAGAIWGGGDGPVVDQSGNLLVATGNSFSGTKFDFGDAVLKLSPAPSLGLVDWFAPTNWAQLNTQDLDLGSTEPVILSSSYLFQIGKEGVGYVLNANNLGHIGGQAYSAQVCDSGHGAYGGLAYSSPYLIVPCDDGLVALNVKPGSNPPFTVAWRGPNYLTGPPIIAGNAVWDVDVSDGRIYTLSLTTGTTLFTDTIGSLPTHFNSLTAGDGQIFVTAHRQVRAYIPEVAVTFHTTPTTFYGTTTPGKITACGATLTDGQSANCADNFTATSTLPSPSANWEFDFWQWNGGVTCTNADTNPTSCTATAAGSVTAVYATLVKFGSTGINWATCGNATEPLDGTVFSPAGTVSACYVPTGFSIASWSCTGGLSCSGTSNVIPVSITGPGTITLNLQTGTLSNPVSTNITALTSTPNPSPGTSFNVSGRLRDIASGVGLPNEPVALVFDWSTSIVTIRTNSTGGYSYTATAPPTPGPYNVDVFFLGDFGPTTQYLPSKATAMISVE